MRARNPWWIPPVFDRVPDDVSMLTAALKLFPTSQRGTSAGWVSLVQTLGWAGGLALVGMGTHAPGDIARLTSTVSLTALPAAAAILLLPETRRRELETISREDVPGSAP